MWKILKGGDWYELIAAQLGFKRYFVTFLVFHIISTLKGC